MPAVGDEHEGAVLTLGVGGQIAVQVKVQGVGGVADHAVQAGTHVAGVGVDVGLSPGLAVLAGSGGSGGGTVDGVDLHGLGGSQLGAGVAVDEGVDHHVAGGQLTFAVVDDLGGSGNLVDVVAVTLVVELDASDVQAAVGVDDSHGVDGLENVLSHAVVVVVNDLQVLAEAVGLDLNLVVSALEVVLNELLIAHPVRQVGGAGDNNIGAVNGDVVIAGVSAGINLTLDVSAVVVGGGEDSQDVGAISRGQLLANIDHLAVLIGIAVGVVGKAVVLLNDLGPASGAVLILSLAGEGDDLITHADFAVGSVGISVNGLGILIQLDQAAVARGAVLIVHGVGVVLAHLNLEDVLQTPRGGVLLDLLEVDEVLSAGNAGDAVGAASGVADRGNLGALVVVDLVQTGVVGLGGDQIIAVGTGGGTDIDVAALTDVVQSGGDIQGALAQGGLTGRQGSGGGQAGVLVRHDHAVDLLHLEGLVSQGLVVLAVGIGGAVAESQGVVGHGNQDGLAEDLGHGLTGGGAAQGALGDVLQNAAVACGGGGLNLPAGTGELVVPVVADGTQDHGQSLVAGHVLLGLEHGLAVGVIAYALDVLGVGAVVDVASIPGVAGDVAELVVVSVDALLGVGHIAGDDAVDDGGNLGTGDVVLGQEFSLVAHEHLQPGEDVNGFSVGFADVAQVELIVGTGDGHEGKAHDECQHQCENLLEISHVGVSSFKIAGESRERKHAEKVAKNS